MSILEEIINEKDANRFVSPFQSMTLQEKIISFIGTSQNIIFGYELEAQVKLILERYGAHYLNRKIEGMDCDQLFEYSGRIYLIEQKIRDDHDSTKKVGQVDNFLNKISIIPNIYGSAMWFIDPYFKKNKNYYVSKVEERQIYYGDEINNFLASIFGEIAKNFFEEFVMVLPIIKQRLQEKSKVVEPIDVYKVKMEKLYDFLSVGDPIEIKKIFFGNEDKGADILSACARAKRKTKKVTLLEELIKNGYFN